MNMPLPVRNGRIRRFRHLVLITAAMTLWALLPSSVAADTHNTAKTYYKAPTSIQCSYAKSKGKVSSTGTCRAQKFYFGPLIARTYRVNAPSERVSSSVSSSAACTPVLDLGCYGPPVPGRYFYADSYNNFNWYFGNVWQTWSIKFDGHTLVPLDWHCAHSVGLVAITYTRCGIFKRDTAQGPRWDIDMRWEESFVYRGLIYTFYHQLTTRLDAYGRILVYTRV